MALMECPECKKEVSNTATTCPHCGFPIATYLNNQASLADFQNKVQRADIRLQKEKTEKEEYKKLVHQKAKEIEFPDNYHYVNRALVASAITLLIGVGYLMFFLYKSAMQSEYATEPVFQAHNVIILIIIWGASVFFYSERDNVIPNQKIFYDAFKDQPEKYKIAMADDFYKHDSKVKRPKIELEELFYDQAPSKPNMVCLVDNSKWDFTNYFDRIMEIKNTKMITGKDWTKDIDAIRNEMGISNSDSKIFYGVIGSIVGTGEVPKRRNRPGSSSSSSSRTSVRCPYCGSTRVSKIGVTSKAVSVGTLGLASNKIGKQWHCNSCKSNF